MKIATLILCLLLASCSTMTFVNGPKMPDTVIREQWHHLALNGLFEVSEPMNVKYSCANQQWDSVTIEKTFVNTLASFTWLYVTVYAPWSIAYECREGID